MTLDRMHALIIRVLERSNLAVSIEEIVLQTEIDKRNVEAMLAFMLKKREVRTVQMSRDIYVQDGGKTDVVKGVGYAVWRRK